MSSDSNFTNPPDSLYRADHDDWREARDRPLPADLRDEIQSNQDALRQPEHTEDMLNDSPTAQADRNNRPAEERRAVGPDEVRKPTRDPSLSRDVDFDAADGDPVIRRGMADPDPL